MMGDEEGDDRPYQADHAKQYTDEQFVSAVKQHGPAATTREVAETVGCSQFTASRRLNELVDEGRVSKKQAGQAFVWTVVE